MSENKTNQDLGNHQKQLKRIVDPQDVTAATAPNSLGRRMFFGRVSASTAVVASAGIGLPSLLSTGKAMAAEDADGPSRKARSYRIRVKAAAAERDIPTPPQISNGDEAQYPNFIGNYSQGLPHNSIGEVDSAAYQALLKAVATGNSTDFANIPLGGAAKLSGPQGGLAFDLEGTDCGQLTIPPSPTVAGAERAGEMVEDYWMAMARDIPFSQYGGEAVTAAAITANASTVPSASPFSKSPMTVAI